MADDAAKVATRYFDAWKVNDFDTMESLVADDVTFVGPFAQLEGVADYMEGIKGMSQITSDIVIQKVFVDGPDVVRPAHDGGSPCSRCKLASCRERQDRFVAGGVRRARTRSLNRSGCSDSEESPTWP